jgi:antitoxin YefM
MKVISSREFRDSQKKYMDMAATERIIIKRKNEFLEIVHRGTTIPENPSPGNDPYFDNPQNIERIEKSIQQAKEGKVIPLNKEDQKELLGV